MRPASAAPLRCPEARALVSERLDGAPVGPEVEQHLRGCAACARFEDAALTLRRAVRWPLADPEADDGREDLTAAVLDAIWAQDRPGPIPGIDLPRGSGEVGDRPDLHDGGDRHDRRVPSDSGEVGDRPDLRDGGDRHDHGVPSDLRDLRDLEIDLGADRPRHGHRSRPDGRRAGRGLDGPVEPDRGRERVRAVLAGVAVFALCAAIGFAGVHWRGGAMPAVASDRSTVVSQGQVLVHSLQADVTLVEPGAVGVPDRHADGTLTYAAPEAVALRLSDGTTSAEVGVNGEVAWRVGADPGSVQGREPFDAAGWSALEVVVPVDAFGRDPGAVAPTDVHGHPAWQISTTVGQVAELLGAFRTGLSWRPLDPADTALLWLDRDTGVPLRIEVTPALGLDRAAWAARQGLIEPPSGPTFVVELDHVAINRPGTEIPAPPAATAARDLGFVDRAVSPAELPDPTWLPSGMTAYRSGERQSQGATGPVLERTWTNGRSWLKVSGTHQWTGSRLFGDLGPLVRPLDIGHGNPVYRSESGSAVAVHADDIDLVVTGSIGEDDLVQVARSLSVIPRPAPDGWPESSAFSLDRVDDLVGRPGGSRPMLVPSLDARSGMDGAVLEREDSIELAVTGPGARGVRIVESPGSALAPVEDPDARAVEVRGRPGRFSPSLGELTWTEQDHVIVLSTHTVELEALLSLADSMRWVS